MIKKFIASPIDRVLNKKSRNAIENGAVAEAIERIEADIERLEGLKASLTQAGNVRLSSATDVTDSTGLALPVTEKNPSIDGSLASEIEQIKNSFGAVDISSECQSPYTIATGIGQKIILRIPALKMIFGAFAIEGKIDNQTVVLHLPVESAYTGCCGSCSCHEKDMVAFPRVFGGEIISSHSVNTSITNGCYLFFIKHK